MTRLQTVEYLEHEGADPRLARAIYQSMQDVVNEGAATKADLLELKSEFKDDIHALEVKLSDKISDLKTHMIYWGFALLGLFITYMEFRWK